MGDRKVHTFSLATLSWIDPRSRFLGLPLPECDAQGKPSSMLTYHDVTAARICRFAQLLTCSITVERGKTVDRAVAPESGMYMRPSFVDTSPRPYHTKRDFMTWTADMAVFTQTVGCRTQAPELVGSTAGQIAQVIISPVTLLIDPNLGKKIGREGAEMTAFPPIWTTLHMVMFADGASFGSVMAHSLFPSMTCYEARSSALTLSTRGLIWHEKSNYNGVPNLDAWRSIGWGKGNPWRVQNPAGVINDSIR